VRGNRAAGTSFLRPCGHRCPPPRAPVRFPVGAAPELCVGPGFSTPYFPTRIPGRSARPGIRCSWPGARSRNLA